MGKSTTTSNNLLKLVFNATAWANIADNAATSPNTSLYAAPIHRDAGEPHHHHPGHQQGTDSSRR